MKSDFPCQGHGSAEKGCFGLCGDDYEPLIESDPRWLAVECTNCECLITGDFRKARERERQLLEALEKVRASLPGMDARIREKNAGWLREAVNEPGSAEYRDWKPDVGLESPKDTYELRLGGIENKLNKLLERGENAVVGDPLPREALLILSCKCGWSAKPFGLVGYDDEGYHCPECNKVVWCTDSGVV